MPDEIVQHYEHEIREEERITVGIGQLELVRTQEVLRRHLPKPPAAILDVGGATGVHASWLAADGYRVHLVDLAPRHVEKARADLGALGVTAALGDARGLADGFLFDPEFRAIVERDLRDGCHRNSDHHPRWFTTAFFHHPDELRDEVDAAGLELIELTGVEGLAGCLTGLDERWDTHDGRETILFAARAIEAEPTLLGLSSHFLAVARAADSGPGTASPGGAT